MALAKSKARRQELEARVSDWVKRSREAWAALRELRDNPDLWSDEFDSWDAYLAEVWGWTRRRSEQILSALGVLDEIADGQENERKPLSNLEGDTNNCSHPVPKNESQLRELAKAAEGTRAEVWQKAKATTGKAQPTAKEIQKVVATRAAKPAAESEPEPAEPWAGFIGELAAIQSELRGIAHRLYKLMDIDADGKHPRCKWAGGYSYDGTVGAVNSLIRALERNAPAEAAKNPRGYLVQWEVDQRDAMKKAGAKR